MALLCKACGKTLPVDAKERRPLNGRPYTALFEMVHSQCSQTVTDIHHVLASTPSYVCKLCHSTLSKYRKQMEMIKIFIKSVFNVEHTEPPSVPVSLRNVGEIWL